MPANNCCTSTASAATAAISSASRRSAEQCQHQHRQDHDEYQAARHAAACVQHEADCHGIDAGVDQRHDAQTGPLQASGDDQQYRCRKIGDAAAKKEAWPRIGYAPVRTGVQLHGDERQRHQQAVEIQKADHAPGEIARCLVGSGRGLRQGFNRKRLELRVRDSSISIPRENATGIAPCGTRCATLLVSGGAFRGQCAFSGAAQQR
jgi:hypothetical protein